MSFSDYIKMAFKNLTRQKSRTVLTIIAITVGSLSLILMASLILGIRKSLVEEFKKLGAFNIVTVIKDPNATENNNLMGTSGDTSEGKLITNVTLADVKKLDHVIAATPILTPGIGTMRMSDSERKTWANLVAYDPTTDVFEVPLAAGRMIKPGDMDKIVMGSRFLEEMKMVGKADELIGKKVVLNSKMGGPGTGIDWGPLPEKPPMNADKSWYDSQSSNSVDIEAEIVGVADNGTAGDGASYINLAWARKLNTQVRWEWGQNGNKDEKGNMSSSNSMTLVKDDNFDRQGYTSIVLKIDDPANLEKVAAEVSALGYGAVTAQAMLDQINQIMTMVGIVLGIIAGISLFVAGIGIINTMIMATYERIREIGVMRACGATRATIRRLFTIEAASLGFWGGVFGVIISFGLGQLAKLLVTKYGANLGNIPVDNIGNFPFWLVLAVLAFTSFVGMVSGLYPAIRASRLDPVEALRYE